MSEITNPFHFVKEWCETRKHSFNNILIRQHSGSDTNAFHAQVTVFHPRFGFLSSQASVTTSENREVATLRREASDEAYLKMAQRLLIEDIPSDRERSSGSDNVQKHESEGSPRQSRPPSNRGGGRSGGGRGGSRGGGRSGGNGQGNGQRVRNTNADIGPFVVPQMDSSSSSTSSPIMPTV